MLTSSKILTGYLNRVNSAWDHCTNLHIRVVARVGLVCILVPPVVLPVGVGVDLELGELLKGVRKLFVKFGVY